MDFITAITYTTLDTLGNMICLDHGVHVMFDAETSSWAVLFIWALSGSDHLEIHTLLPCLPASLFVQKH
jgi:hypothetical protein